MPHRDPLRLLLTAYLEDRPEDAARVAPVLALLQGTPRCFERDALPGHVTASAWILDAERRRSLLTHHKKLGRWLQLGGHADGETDVHAVALREAREESGLVHFEFFARGGGVRPLDVDVHWIPPRKDAPGHWHHDVRFLLIAGPDQSIACSDESVDLRWFTDSEVLAATDEDSVLRLLRRARELVPAAG